MLTVNHTTYE